MELKQSCLCKQKTEKKNFNRFPSTECFAQDQTEENSSSKQTNSQRNAKKE